jgi:hypothetical protein
MPVSLTARVGSLILTDLFKRNLLQDHRVVMCQLVYGGEQLPKQFLRLGVLLNKFAEVENNCLSGHPLKILNLEPGSLRTVRCVTRGSCR